MRPIKRKPNRLTGMWATLARKLRGHRVDPGSRAYRRGLWRQRTQLPPNPEWTNLKGIKAKREYDLVVARQALCAAQETVQTIGRQRARYTPTELATLRPQLEHTYQSAHHRLRAAYIRCRYLQGQIAELTRYLTGETIPTAHPRACHRLRHQTNQIGPLARPSLE